MMKKVDDILEERCDNCGTPFDWQPVLFEFEQNIFVFCIKGCKDHFVDSMD